MPCFREWVCCDAAAEQRSGLTVSSAVPCSQGLGVRASRIPSLARRGSAQGRLEPALASVGQAPERGSSQPQLGDLNSFPAFGNKDMLQGKFKFLALCKQGNVLWVRAAARYLLLVFIVHIRFS